MPLSPRTLRPSSSFTPRSISGLALWLDASAAGDLYTTDAGPVTAVSSPTEISGCVGWYDASDAASITASGGSVSQWNDKSGANRTLRQPTSGSRPSTGTRAIAGKNVLDFDGTNAFLSYVDGSGNPIYDLDIATPKAVTVFCVVAADTTSTVRDILGIQRTGKNANDSGVYVRRHTNLSGSIEFAAGAGASTSNDELAKNNIRGFANTSTGPMVVSLTLSANAGQYDAHLNGVGQALTSRYGTLDIAGFLSEGSGNHTLDIGATRNASNLITTTSRWDGAIAEIVVYNTALSVTNRARIEAYLAAKWGISGVHAAATAASDPVGYWRSRVGSAAVVQATAAARPTLTTGYYAGRSALTFDGGDVLANLSLPIAANGMSIGVIFDETTRVAFAGLVVGAPASGNDYDASPSNGFRMSVHEGTNRPVELLAAVTNNLDLRGPLVNETGVLGKSVAMATVAPSVAGVGSAAMRFNGFSGAEDTLYGPPLTTNGIVIGGRFISGAVSSLYRFNGRILEVAVWNRALNLSEVQSFERYAARKWGIPLPTQVSNPDAQDWINRVYANGGTVSASTASAVNTFIDGCLADGIWNKMNTVGLLCGASTLNGAITPLKGGTFTNNNFVSGDYNAATGLKGGTAAQNKALVTSLLASSLSNTSHHLFVAGSDFETTAGTFNVGGVFLSASSSLLDLLLGNNRRCRSGTFDGAGNSANAPNSSSTNGSIALIRTSSTDLRYYSDGVSGTAASNNNNPSLPAIAISVFARNDNGTRSEHTAARIAFFSIGSGLTEAETLALHNRVATLRNAIAGGI